MDKKNKHIIFLKAQIIERKKIKRRELFQVKHLKLAFAFI